jgi:hypothetical protein
LDALHSKIRGVGARDRGVSHSVVFVFVLGADDLKPIGDQGAPVGNGR